ncbi:MAG: helix-turn-helix domain-containing protein [Pseudonocardiaceae bacterium]
MTIKGVRAKCPQCDAQLRQGQPVGSRCDPCVRKGLRLVLPPEFYDRPRLDAALAVYDFGTVFRAIRCDQNWTQEQFGQFVDLSQARVSDIERGVRPLWDVRVVARVATRCAIPAVKLGFGATTVAGAGADRWKGVSWVDRRDFVQHVAGLTLGLGAAGVDVERLMSLLPRGEPTGTRHIAAADVETVEQVTAAFRRQDFAHGSGLTCHAAVAQLRSVLPLLNAQASPDVRSRLMLATARLAMMTGWMNFDANQQDAARRLWMIGLDIARDADHPLGSDLTAYLLFDMALQAVHLGRPDEALRLVQIGQGAASGPHPVSASTISSLASVQATAYATRHDTAACERALGQAEEQFSSIDPTTCPPWNTHLDDAGIASHRGAAHYALARSGGDPRAARRAVPLLRHAVDHFGTGYAKLQALCLPNLAGAHALAGDTDTAVTIAHQAIDAVTAVHSPRAHSRLRILNTVLEPVHTSPGVAELRNRLTTAA